MPKPPLPPAATEAKVPSPGTLARYGLSVAEWRAILERGEGKCYICRKVPRSGIMVIDHEHVRGWKTMSPFNRKRYVRGVLCNWCNAKILGRFVTVDKLVRALEYMRAHEARVQPKGVDDGEDAIPTARR